MIRLVCFDMDGVLLDSMPALTIAAVETISHVFGVSTLRANELYKQTVGSPFRQQLDEVFPGDCRINQAVEIYEQMHHVMASTFKVAPTAKALLDKLRIHKIKRALVSSTDRNIILNTPQILALDFDYVGGYQNGHTKFFQIKDAMSHLKIGKLETVLIGDSPSDAFHAAEAGVAFSYAYCINLEKTVISFLRNHR